MSAGMAAFWEKVALYRSTDAVHCLGPWIFGKGTVAFDLSAKWFHDLQLSSKDRGVVLTQRESRSLGLKQ